MSTRVFTFASVLFSSIALQAQLEPPLPCLVDDDAALRAYYLNDPDALQQIEQDREELEQFTRDFEAAYNPGVRNTYVIPVVFHVIHNNGPENISDLQILDAMRVLNNDFNKLNTDWPSVKPEFLDRVADVGFEFRLAQKDPQGNCTNGITRTQSTLTYSGDQAMKNLIQWPRNRYLNVWVSASANGAAGYTYTPGSVNNSSALDGIVLLSNYTGSIGTSTPYTSRTLTHEVGHWINLRHTWGGTNEPGLASNCNTDDNVADTPNTIGWQTCNLSGVTCGSLDNVENYMDYSYCSKMFTEGQKARMIAALNSTTAQRDQLWTPANLAFTGVDGPGVLCKAQFSSSSQSVCNGTQITFTDQSFHNVVSRTWSFPGGNPASSTAATPTVTYDTPGVYEVSLQVSDGNTTLSSTQTTLITVLANPGAPVPLEEGFEAYTTIEDAPWTVVNSEEDNTFRITDAAAFTGSQSIRVLNNSSMAGRKDELVSNTFDMSDAASIRISYRYAYARRNSSNDDRLRLHVSNNCGQTWSLRQQLRGSNTLQTTGTMTGTFVPNGPEQWDVAEVNNISSAYHSSDFRFKFEFESDGGNTLYIDDININGSPVGINEIQSGARDMIVMPNPASGEARLIFEQYDAARVTVEIMDPLGRSLGIVHEGMASAGKHQIELPIAKLSAGVYFVNLVLGEVRLVQRLVVE